MFIEYEIKEKDNIWVGIINCDHLCNIVYRNYDVVVEVSDGSLSFKHNKELVYEAFKRAICGESVVIDEIGFVRPLKPHPSSSNPMWPVTSINWRDCA